MPFLGDELWFPPADTASSDGLLAIGGDLSVERLILAYSSGIFPWFNEDTMIFWWSPDPRMVLFPEKLRISKSMRPLLKNDHFRITKNTCFSDIIDACAKAKRPTQEGTWITQDMKDAYLALHEKGIAVSYEVWEDDDLVGGLYGVDLNGIFCGESMFSKVSNASKFAFIKMVEELQAKNYVLIDCQMYTEHLASMGAETIPREKFLRLLKANIK
ncbi:MAG: leucyl/phenylalanyl-tRNA--protein transferase [Eudoraea sp.]|nr:leucyl/phenylalanyl-tRNA--protein transferase [Eudoraea sp.]